MFKCPITHAMKCIHTHKGLSVFFISVGLGALLFALAAEYIFDIKPCDLCLYQRHIMGALMGLGFVGILTHLSSLRWLYALVICSGVCLSIYHTGVEQKWWKGPVACTTYSTLPSENLSLSERIEHFQKQTEDKSFVRCDEINWRILGVSATSWMILFYLILLGCTYRSFKSEME